MCAHHTLMTDANKSDEQLQRIVLCVENRLCVHTLHLSNQIPSKVKRKQRNGKDDDNDDCDDAISRKKQNDPNATTFFETNVFTIYVSAYELYSYVEQMVMTKIIEKK